MAESEQEQEARPRLSASKKLAFAGVSLFILIGALELIGRAAGLPSGALRTLSKMNPPDQATFDQTLGMWRPSYRGRVSWPIQVAYDVSINSLGFRGPEIERQKPAGRLRILCIGDSTTFGSHVDDADTYPRQLEAMLRADGIDAEVINGGHPAWGPIDQLRFLKERAIKTRPDLVLHMFCINDPFDTEGAIAQPDKAKYTEKLASIKDGLSFADWLRFHTAIGEMETRLHIAWKQARGKERLHKPGQPSQVGEHRWGLFEKAYADLVAFCRSEKVPLMSLCFPEIVELKDPSQRAEARVKAMAGALDVPFVETAAAFRAAEAGGKKLYNLPYDNHANADGNRIIAERVAAAIKKRR